MYKSIVKWRRLTWLCCSKIWSVICSGMHPSDQTEWVMEVTLFQGWALTLSSQQTMDKASQHRNFAVNYSNYLITNRFLRSCDSVAFVRVTLWWFLAWNMVECCLNQGGSLNTVNDLISEITCPHQTGRNSIDPVSTINQRCSHSLRTIIVSLMTIKHSSAWFETAHGCTLTAAVITTCWLNTESTESWEFCHYFTVQNLIICIDNWSETRNKLASHISLLQS